METRKIIRNEIKKMTSEEIESSVKILKKIISEKEQYNSVCFRNPNRQRSEFNHYYEANVGSVCVLYHGDYFESAQYSSYTSTILFNDDVTTLTKVKTILDVLQKSFKSQETKENE